MCIKDSVNEEVDEGKEIMVENRLVDASHRWKN
jgi:hypothetical protein